VSRSSEEIFSEILSLLELTRVGEISSSSVPRPRRRFLSGERMSTLAAKCFMSMNAFYICTRWHIPCMYRFKRAGTTFCR